jgi:hypothetical protein
VSTTPMITYGGGDADKDAESPEAATDRARRSARLAGPAERSIVAGHPLDRGGREARRVDDPAPCEGTGSALL